VLATEVTYLAGLRKGIIASWSLAANVRVKMGEGASAIAICWDRSSVDVVD
jgi:hypothetical protein